ncbi:MAG: 3'(2'),5'-bisphosphate nucleotidase CysQ family protein, partial [Bacteroidia bacterium]
QRILYGGIGYGVFIADFNGLDSAAEIVKSNLPTPKSNLTMIASSSHHNKLISDFAGNNKILISQFIQKGSALKFFDLALNNAQVYPRFAPTMEWDIAAGQAILEALGGGVFDINTKAPLIYNKEMLINPSFIAVSDVSLIQCF